MVKDLASIKLIQNSGINLNFEDVRENANVLIIGNTIGFFGYVSNNNFVTNVGKDLQRLGWLIKSIQKKVNFTIVGEIEEREYYFELFSTIKNKYNLKAKVIFKETKTNKDYEKILEELNMKFDYIVGNPPFGSVGGDTLHLKCIDKVFDKFIKKMLIIMPWGFVTKDTKSFKKYQIKFAPKLQYVKEILGNNFEGTHMGPAAIYEFTNEETETTIIEDLSGNKTEKSDLTNVSLFTPYDEEIIKYLESQGQNEGIACGGHDHCTKQSLNKRGIFNEEEINNLIVQNIKDNCNHIPENKIYLLVNAANGGMNGTFMSSKAGIIFTSKQEVIDLLVNRQTTTFSNLLLFNTIKEAENCKQALKRPLLRFTCFKTQLDQMMTIKRVYKYVPAIDWEDERCLTDEGLLEICGCPKDKAKEYAEYVKNYVEERDKECESRKKRK